VVLGMNVTGTGNIRYRHSTCRVQCWESLVPKTQHQQIEGLRERTVDIEIRVELISVRKQGPIELQSVRGWCMYGVV